MQVLNLRESEYTTKETISSSRTKLAKKQVLRKKKVYICETLDKGVDAQPWAMFWQKGNIKLKMLDR